MIGVDGIPRTMYGEPLQGKVAFAPSSLGGGPRGVAGSGGGIGEPVTAAISGGPSASAGEATGPGPSSQENVGWGQMFKNSREYTVLKRVVHLLQDNRLTSGDEETVQRLQDLNRSQSESYPILKTILNVIFITTGVVLLIAVVVVIIYTSIVKPDGPSGGGSSLAGGGTDEHPSDIGAPSETHHLHRDSFAAGRDRVSTHHPPIHLPGRPSASIGDLRPTAQPHPPPSVRPPQRTKTATRCQMVPVFVDGQSHVQFAKICSDASSSAQRNRTQV